MKPRLEYWNYYGDFKRDWFKWEQMTAMIDGQEVTFLTERLVNEEDLAPVDENYRRGDYWTFIAKMIKQISEDPYLPEGQSISNRERQ